MYPYVDLKLLSESLENIPQTPYFNQAIKSHADALVKVIGHVIEKSPEYDDGILRSLINHVWNCRYYLVGSTINETPYEAEYCMHKAIKDWNIQKHCIATALVEDEKNFYFELSDPWEFVSNSIVGFDKKLIPKEKLIQLSLPRLYKDLILFCTALYHELGHYVDVTNSVSEATLLINPVKKDIKGIVLAHRREHFADLFAACYTGKTLIETLISMGYSDTSYTHPATAVRVDVIRGFIDGEKFDELEMYQNALKKRGLPPLKIRYKSPDIESAFNDMLPYKIESIEEMHGLFVAGWSYLGKIKSGDGPPWSRGRYTIDLARIVNNLIGKSIRNYSIIQQWKGN